MTELVGGQRAIAYSSATGQYIDQSTKRFIPRTEVMRFVDGEVARTRASLQGHTRLMAAQKITLAEWEVRMAQSLKDSHIRLAALGSGGVQNLNAKKYGAVGYQLRKQYEYLDGFARDLKAGKLTPGQALTRAGMYADSAVVSFHRAEQITKQEEKFQEAKRSLHPAARHCSSCLAYSTKGKWLPIDQVVMPGVNCECGQHCRCSVQYRYRRIDPKVLNKGTLEAA
ncbi:hypothetical protein H6G00_05135 [Leptolyngbya sp. FACHB-541]|uniref:hypothetical protein n=1 Tax=Leptolyngbya sp. FACHB-541 TaxID=2692810 RepID=UPI001687B53B|nr:hypothetical protein [Leptolyngbya sp. FACHB-541]MBD1996000.1 hypothetical protein [Leptolyngbya sp. FACHB-541]